MIQPLAGEVGHPAITGASQFIESEAVSGFVRAAKGTPGSIVVRQPQMLEPKPFPEEADRPELFERRVDTTDQWEVSFHRSIADDADGVVLIGGANSVMIAGQVAIGARVPMVALEKAGGSPRCSISAGAGHLFPLEQRGLPVWLLLFSTLLGGGSGAAIRRVFERRYGVGALVTRRSWSLSVWG